MRTSLALHAGVLTAVLLIPAQALSRPPRTRKELNVTFFRAPKIEPPARALPLPPAREGTGLQPRPLPGAARPAPRTPEPKLPGPDEPGNPEFAKGPDQ